MKRIFNALFLAFLFVWGFSPLQAQDATVKGAALEGIIVEKYYAATKEDIADTTGGKLRKGAVTYRIYVDLKPGCKLQAVYGVPGHDLVIKTSTEFFNHTKGVKTGDQVDHQEINDNTLVLDSWLTLGSATKSHFGILKEEDKDGSIIRRPSLKNADGLIEQKMPALVNYLLDLRPFDAGAASSRFFADNGSLAAFSSVQGPTDGNKVLIAQLTTDGQLSFELNLQIGNPSCGVENYVARNPQGEEIKFDGLIYGQ